MAKKGELSLFEMQKATKPAIEDICGIILTDPELRAGMASLLELSCELKMKPCWSVTNGYSCSYKGKRVVNYGVGRGDRWEENWLNINVFTADKGDLDNFLQALPDEMQAECIDNMQCTRCGGCAPINLKILGSHYDVCWKMGYGHLRPTAEQFQWIEKFILARREYIKSIT